MDNMNISGVNIPTGKAQAEDQGYPSKVADEQCRTQKGQIGFYIVVALVGVLGLSFLFKPKENGFKLTKWTIVFIVSATLLYNLFFSGTTSWSKQLMKDCSKA